MLCRQYATMADSMVPGLLFDRAKSTGYVSVYIIISIFNIDNMVLIIVRVIFFC